MDAIMLDLETAGTRRNAPILSIGAVKFDVERKIMGEKFYCRIKLDQAARIEPDTFMWWLQQSEEARAEIYRPEGKIATWQALKMFSAYAKGVKEVWANGPDFDCVILGSAYSQHKEDLPWEYRHQRCFRTVRSLAPHIEYLRVGTAHNALDDAVSQVEHLFRMTGGVQ